MVLDVGRLTDVFGVTPGATRQRTIRLVEHGVLVPRVRGVYPYVDPDPARRREPTLAEVFHLVMEGPAPLAYDSAMAAYGLGTLANAPLIKAYSAVATKPREFAPKRKALPFPMPSQVPVRSTEVPGFGTVDVVTPGAGVVLGLAHPKRLGGRVEQVARLGWVITRRGQREVAAAASRARRSAHVRSVPCLHRRRPRSSRSRVQSDANRARVADACCR